MSCWVWSASCSVYCAVRALNSAARLKMSVTRRTPCTTWTGSGCADGKSRSSSLREIARVSFDCVCSIWDESVCLEKRDECPLVFLSARSNEVQGAPVPAQPLALRRLRSGRPAQTLAQSQPRSTQITEPVLREAPPTLGQSQRVSDRLPWSLCPESCLWWRWLCFSHQLQRKATQQTQPQSRTRQVSVQNERCCVWTYYLFSAFHSSHGFKAAVQKGLLSF